MKVLFVKGDDYSALEFEESNYTVEEIAQLIESKDEEKLENIREEFGYIEFQLFEFGEVDSKFIDFVRNKIQDYDISKAENFYEVEEQAVK